MHTSQNEDIIQSAYLRYTLSESIYGHSTEGSLPFVYRLPSYSAIKIEIFIL